MDPQQLYASLNGPQVTGAPPPIDYADILGYGLPPSIPVPEPEPAPTPVAKTPLAEPSFAPPEIPLPAPVPAPQIQPPIVSQGAKVGVSQSGYSPDAYAKIQKNATGLERKLNADEAGVEASYGKISEDARAASDLAQTATIEAAGIESHKLRATSEAKLRIAEAQTDFMAKEQAAIENARAEANAAHGDYRAALLDYAAAKVNPAQLWESGGMSGQFAMLATAFGHDFLGARGIKTSGMESIKTAIQNNINSQLENMRKKGEVAAGFKQLWDMQRQQSTTDTEARARMNGFYLQALSNQIDANLAGYDSELALAKGQAAKAAIMQEQVKNDALVRKQIDEAANARAMRRIQVYGIDMAASTSRYSTDASLTIARMNQAAKEKAADPTSGLIYDTSTSGKNTASRRFHPEIKADDMFKIKDQTAKSVKTVENIQKLSDLQDQIDATPPGDVALIKRLQGERARTAELVRNLVRMNIIYDNSGKQINEQEMKLYDQIVSQKDWFLNGDNRRTLGTLADMSMEKTKAILSAVSDEILPGDPAFGKTSGSTAGFAPAESARAEIESGEGAGRPAVTEADQLFKDATSPDAGEEAFKRGKLGDKEIILEPKDKRTSALVYEDLFDKYLAENPGVRPDSENADKAFIAVDRLADLAKSGDKDAKKKLDTLANKDFSKGVDNVMDVVLRSYAQWEKAQKGL